jgi:hypothetical protein
VQRCYFATRAAAERQRHAPTTATRAGDFCIAAGPVGSAPPGAVEE